MKKPNKEQSTRLLSLDALRGFDMLWISGGHLIIASLAALTGWSVFTWLEGQMDHTAWNGFTFYDLIFPLFLFISGVTWPFSYDKRRRNGQTKTKIYRHMVQRLLLLVFFGMIYNGLLHFDFENMRYASVLARIGFAWFFAAMIVVHVKPSYWPVWLGGILLVYWGLLTLIPVPGFGAGNLTMEGSLVAYIDRLLLPGKLYRTVHDPEGILSTIPAIGTALMGSITGKYLMRPDANVPRMRKFYMMLAAGAVAMVIGWLWGQIFPINKNLWTSSFVLFAGGLSLVLLSLFYLVIDVWGYKRWAFFFVVIGMNAITIYMLQSGILDFWGATDYFFGGIVENTGALGELIHAIGYVTIVWLLLYLLYKKRIFLRV